MFKAIVLSIAAVATVSAMEFTPDEIAAVHANVMEADYNMQHISRVLGVNYHLDSAERLGQGSVDKTTCGFNNINWEDISGFAHGFAFGLQFSSVKKGLCYMSTDSLLSSFDSITGLALEAYNP